VASRATPVRTDPGAGSSWLSPGFPDRDTCPDAPPPASCPDGVLVAIDVHGSEDQEKDASTADQESHVSVVLVSGACTSKSTCGRNVPFLSTLWTSAVAGASPRGEEPVPDGGPNQGLRSDAVPRRTTPSRRPGCLPPLRSAPSVRARISPHPNLARRSLAHAAHTLSPGGESAFTGLASTRVRSPAIPGIRGTGAFGTEGISILSDLSCLGLTTQARPSARTTGADGED
jgi:hypothetical protein